MRIKSVIIKIQELMKNAVVVFALALFFFIASYFFHNHLDVSKPHVVNTFQQKLVKKEHRLNSEMQLLSEKIKNSDYTKLFAEKPAYYNTLLEEEGLALLIYENDTLKFWSDNSIAVENWMKEVCLDTRIVKLRNGWFEVMKPISNSVSAKTVVGLILIKYEFPYQNKYLVNEFQNDFALTTAADLIVNPALVDTKITNESGDYLFSLQFLPDVASKNARSYISLIAAVAGLVLFFLFLKLLYETRKNFLTHNLRLILFVAILWLVRFVTLKFSFPHIFYDFELFNPIVYADSSSIWFSSLGDLFLNSVLLLLSVHLLVRYFDFNGIVKRLRGSNVAIFSILVFWAFCWMSWFISSVFLGLIRNSNIPFTINNLFSVNWYTYVALFSSGILLFAYFLIADKIISIYEQWRFSIKQYILGFVFGASIHTAILHFQGIRDLIIVFCPFVLLITVFLFKRSNRQYTFTRIVFLLFLFAFFAMHLFVKHTAIKEVESMRKYARKLVVEQDPVAEYLFEDIKTNLSADSLLWSYISKGNKQPQEFEKRLKQEYFSGFWDKYDVHITYFDSLCYPVVSSPNSLFDNTIYFDELMANKGVQTSCEQLTFISSESGRANYLAKLPASKFYNGNLYIELGSKFISDEIGFPELLLDGNMGISSELKNYSYAKYKSGRLINQFGKYAYTNNDATFKTGVVEDDFSLIAKNNYNHLVYQPNENTLIVISKINEGLFYRITAFSYMFTLYSLLLIIVLLYRAFNEGVLFKNLGFKYRIQLYFVVIVLTSLALFGGSTVYYMQRQFETKNRETISEKLHSILMEVETQIAEEKALDKRVSGYVTFVLKRMSNVFFTDINLYDLSGNLYASSRPIVFDEGLTSKKMDPEAYLQMAILGKTEFIHDERIGRLEYLSAHIPFKNKEGKLLGFVNLPYFAKQGELEKEISGFLVALINIYVLLLILSIIAAILVSNYITEPLKLIQEKLSNIKLGHTNELIAWPENDEIGSLVNEYNRMILELSKSAELLAKSERESAWREMAKQVAHEIKNPLTPMKLSIQHLKRVWNDNAPDKEQKLDRLTQTIIEQIDTLSTIATEFSNFAKMPKANLERLDVVEIIKSSVELYKDTPQMRIVFNCGENDIAIVMADKEQLLRVFNNLIKNAIQAIPEEKEGVIEISVSTVKPNYLITLKDNGTGISDDVIEKIFVPNFTTKTTGMGLGLAMVKNIIESVNGTIRFETDLNVGTCFYITLPEYIENE